MLYVGPSDVLTAGLSVSICKTERVWYACSSGGSALTAEVRGPQFNPGWLLVFHSLLKAFIMYVGTERLLDSSQ